MTLKHVWLIISGLSFVGLCLVGCIRIPSLITMLPTLLATQSQPLTETPTSLDPGAIIVPADWTLYQSRRFTYGFYYPSGWRVRSESTSRVYFEGENGESFVFGIVQAECGLGADDIAEENILDCLANSGEAIASVNGEGYLISKDWNLEHDKWVYTMSYIVSYARSVQKQYLLTTEFPEHKMAIGLYEAPIIGSRTRSELRLLMASVRYGRIVADVVTPTPLPTPTVNPATPLPRITLPASATFSPVIIPSGWLESDCATCGIYYFRPPTWELVQEGTVEMLWRAPDSGFIIVRASEPVCDFTQGTDPDQSLACLAAYRSQQAPENADYELLDGGYTHEGQGITFWIRYRSSTPSDSRPVYGLVMYSLLADNQMLTVEYARVSHLPDSTIQTDLQILANNVRVGKAQITLATPSPTASPRVAPSTNATPDWLEPLQPARYPNNVGGPEAR